MIKSQSATAKESSRPGSFCLPTLSYAVELPFWGLCINALPANSSPHLSTSLLSALGAPVTDRLVANASPRRSELHVPSESQFLQTQLVHPSSYKVYDTVADFFSVYNCRSAVRSVASELSGSYSTCSLSLSSRTAVLQGLCP